MEFLVPWACGDFFLREVLKTKFQKFFRKFLPLRKIPVYNINRIMKQDQCCVFGKLNNSFDTEFYVLGWKEVKIELLGVI